MYSNKDKNSYEFLTPIKGKKDDCIINKIPLHKHHNTTSEITIDCICISEQFKPPTLSFDEENGDECIDFSKTNGSKKRFYCTLKERDNILRRKTLNRFRAYDGITSTALNLNNEFLEVRCISPTPSCDSASFSEEKKKVENNVPSSNHQICFQSKDNAVLLGKRKLSFGIYNNKSAFVIEKESLPSDLFLPTF